jgi:hypothetical protein
LNEPVKWKNWFPGLESSIPFYETGVVKGVMSVTVQAIHKLPKTRRMKLLPNGVGFKEIDQRLEIDQPYSIRFYHVAVVYGF